MPEGRVYIIGAGPGDPDLLTVRGRRIVESADLVVYADSLVDPRVGDLAKPGAEVIGSAALTLEEIAARMIEAARAGRTVARLHSGDPSIYGALHEQLALLDAAGVPYEIVPGVSSAFAAAAALGVELTVPEVTQTVIFTRLSGRASPVPEAESLRALASHRASLAIFLSVTMMRRVVEELIAGGYPPDTPAAVLYRVTWPDEAVVRGTLATIADQVRAAGWKKQAIVLVGRALDPALRAELARRSRLYSGNYSHLFRRARQPEAGRSVLIDEAAPGVESPRPRPSRESGEEGACALVSVSRDGALLAARLAPALGAADLYVEERFAALAGERARPIRAPLAAHMGDWFAVYRRLVLLMPVGAATRLIAPHLRDKREDPAVVVLDDQGRFAVALAGGHRGGANELARRVAAVVGATPVVTTAADLRSTLAVDLLGREWGWRIEAERAALLAASAAAINGEPLGAYQDAGEEDWWQGPLPTGLVRYSSLEALAAAGVPALVISDRTLPQELPADVAERWVVYRPPTLYVGVGCVRGASADELEDRLRRALAEHGLALGSVAALASIELKRDEPGLLELAARHRWPLRLYRADELEALGPLPGASAAVRAATGASGVCEPAALLASGGGQLIVPKQRSARATVAIARRASPLPAHEQSITAGPVGGEARHG